MKISVISFTKTGQQLAERIRESMNGGDETIILYSKCSRKKTVQTAKNSGDVTTQTFGGIPNKDSNVPTDNTRDTIAVQESVSAWAGEQMAAHHALIFIGACGIAVRAIAPWIMDKLHDSPVLVADEMGKYVIPLLSGHVGGANELAVRLAGALGAIPVITTATDLHDSFAVDIFAKRNDLRICNREGIARVSAKVLAGEEITMSIQTGHLAVDETIPSGIRLCAYPPAGKVDVLIADGTEEIFRKESAELLLQPKKYILGVGCKRDTDSAKLDLFLKKILEEQGIVIEQIAALASIDVKKEERCLLEFSEKYRIPFRTYTAQELQAVPGEFHSSEFVKAQVGVDNVCERAALKAAGTGGWICLDKHNRIYIVGIGPGREEMMTGEAVAALEQADVIVGYTVYVKLLGERFAGKKLLTTPMRQETKRCELCFREAEAGKRVALICSGDAGIYGLASLMYELGEEHPQTELIVIPGITAASSGAAVLGAPLNHDFCVISLSDLLTPWEKIEKRLRAAATGDFAMAIYNPSSHRRKDYLQRACDILLETIEGERPCGYVENIGREGTRAVTCTLRELRDREVNMFTTVFIGNSETEILRDKLITKRGYHVENNIH